MRRNLILPTLFAVVVVSSLACPVLGQEVSVKEIWRSGIGDPVVAVALSQDGLYGAVTTEERVYLYDQNGTILWRYPVSHSRSVAISSDSERIVAGGDHLLLFDRKGNVIWRYKPESRIQGVAVAADGRTICAGAGTSLRVFSLDDGQTTANASWSFDTGGPVRSVSTDGDGSSIVAGGDSGNIYFFSGDGRLLWNYRTGSHGVRVAVSRDGSTVAAASIQRVTFLLNRNGRLLWKSPMPEMITDVSISGDGSTLLLANGSISVFNRDGEAVWTYVTEEKTRCVSASSDITHILAGTLDGTVWAFRVQPETFPAGTSETSSPDTAFTAGPPQTSVSSAPGQTLPQQGTALSPATPVTMGACFAALALWRRQKR
ncbi:MAG: WD-domain containing protein [Methanoculleus marisnigri]|uniref:WD-domain containing protein n=1 Tax=Methanoculleus marisnigri TaxID=2198 RepID=A0A101IQG2_9EURY|nr:MAG: WD-domain containing protein [Methanoculleus marisnigri]KUK99481.1 MAG: WD-domain containing protein [Methanoculleus marisnigri]